MAAIPSHREDVDTTRPEITKHFHKLGDRTPKPTSGCQHLVTIPRRELPFGVLKQAQRALVA